MRIMGIVLGILLSLTAIQQAQAEKLDLMRRWVVFPFDTDESVRTAAENAWWKCRERITDKKKYLVGSKQFLVQKDVFQPRKELKPDDVKLLAGLLDANVLVTGYSEHRQFTMNAYLGQSGALLWTKHGNFHPSLKASDQLELVADKLTQELLATVPYQGFTVIDPLIGKAVFEEVGKQYVIIDVGSTEGLNPGMDLQWVEMILPDKFEPGKPVIGESKLAVIGEGRITKIKRGVVVAELLRAKAREAISEKTLVRISKVAEHQQDYITSESPQEKSGPELLPTIINPVAPESDNAKRQTMVFGSILSVLGILALAF